MSLKVKLFLLKHEWSDLETIGLIIAKDDESHVNLILKLEDIGVVDWLIMFWDVEDKVMIKMKIEKLNTILPEMHVIPLEFEFADVTKRCRVGGDSYVFKSAPHDATKVEVVLVRIMFVEGTHVDPASCSKVRGSESKSKSNSLLLKSLLILKRLKNCII